MGAAGRAHAASTYDIARLASDHDRLYRQLLATHRGSGRTPS